MKKALIFDPYLDTLGGGERYTLTFALGLSKIGYQVEIAWPDQEILSEASRRFGLDFSGVRINSAAYDQFRQKTSLWQRFILTKKYDLIFWVSDGSLPFLFSKNNLVHFQVPFVNLGGHPLINKLKSIFVNKFIYNSKFTQAVHETHLDNQKSFVLYPPIDTDSFKRSSKEHIILSVARFGSPMHSKRQDILIKSFKMLSNQTDGYQLILAGGLVGDTSIIDHLKEQAVGLNVQIIINPDFDKLKSLYSKSTFFWHAAGFGVNEEKNPEKVEHFGMTTVEAMASGCIPFVIAKGGQKEIITPGTGFLCDNEEDLSGKTLSIIRHPDQIEMIRQQATSRSTEFSITKFYEKIRQLVS